MRNVSKVKTNKKQTNVEVNIAIVSSIFDPFWKCYSGLNEQFRTKWTDLFISALPPSRVAAAIKLCHCVETFCRWKSKAWECCFNTRHRFDRRIFLLSLWTSGAGMASCWFPVCTGSGMLVIIPAAVWEPGWTLNILFIVRHWGLFLSLEVSAAYVKGPVLHKLHFLTSFQHQLMFLRCLYKPPEYKKVFLQSHLSVQASPDAYFHTAVAVS